jgi:putative hydrolase of the HAD superfamily
MMGQKGMTNPGRLPIRGIGFDWGGVIIDEPSADLQRYCSLRLQLPVESGSSAIWRHLPQYQTGAITERELWQRVCDECQQSHAVIPDASLWSAALRAVFRFRPEVMDAISGLRKNGYKTGFLSNTEPEAAAYFYERQLDALFDARVLSCEVGVSKPDEQIYLMLANRLQLLPSQILFLDDRSENIDGARNAGMAAVCVDTTDGVMDALRPYL